MTDTDPENSTPGPLFFFLTIPMFIVTLYLMGPAFGAMLSGDPAEAVNETRCTFNSKDVDYSRSYELAGQSEYVENIESKHQNGSFVIITWSDYDGRSPTGIRLFDGGEEISSDGVSGVDASSEVYLTPEESGIYELAIVNRQSGLFRSTEYTVLDRVDVRVQVNKTVEVYPGCER